jgi:exodeoxyribonuclease V alpha subunit
MNPADLHATGFLDLLDVELARSLARMSQTSNADVELAIALTSRSVRAGHSCFPIGTSSQDVWPAEAIQSGTLPDSRSWRDALSKNPLTNDGPLVLDDAGRLYLRRYWQLEQDVANQLARRAEPRTSTADETLMAEALQRLFPGSSDSPPRRAARNALHHRVSLLCGGPGTGKTTTVAAIVALLVEAKLHEAGPAPRVMLLAPTGKSAARLAEAVRQAKDRIDASKEVLDRIPDEARTIHRALGMQRQGMRFARGANHPLEADIIVVDEASMIDLALMRQLLDATGGEATLLIVGDPDQLTSVEAGSVLRDLVTADETTWWHGRVTRLTKTYRYDAAQPLGVLVEGIRGGNRSIMEDLLTRVEGSDVVWMPPEGLAAELDRAARHWTAALATRDCGAHFEMRGRCVMLTPFRVGPIGTRRLGAEIRERLPKLPDGAGGVTPIIIEENSHELRVYNGDFAMLFDEEPPFAVVPGDDEPFRKIAEARLPRYSDAFALSVHKAQGSEFDEVLIVFPEEDAPLLTRELLYTAVSRARYRVRMVGPKDLFLAALSRRAKRYSGLVDAIAEVEHVSLQGE